MILFGVLLIVCIKLCRYGDAPSFKTFEQDIISLSSYAIVKRATSSEVVDSQMFLFFTLSLAKVTQIHVLQSRV